MGNRGYVEIYVRTSDIPLMPSFLELKHEEPDKKNESWSLYQLSEINMNTFYEMLEGKFRLKAQYVGFSEEPESLRNMAFYGLATGETACCETGADGGYVVPQIQVDEEVEQTRVFARIFTFILESACEALNEDQAAKSGK